MVAAITKKKEETAIFSDDDDFLGGLGIEEKGGSKPSTATKPAPEVEDFDSDSEEKPSRMFDKLLGKDSNVNKHLETKERKEFILDKKYTQPAEGKPFLCCRIVQMNPNSLRFYTYLFNSIKHGNYGNFFVLVK